MKNKCVSCGWKITFTFAVFCCCCILALTEVKSYAQMINLRANSYAGV